MTYRNPTKSSKYLHGYVYVLYTKVKSSKLTLFFSHNDLLIDNF